MRKPDWNKVELAVYAMAGAPDGDQWLAVEGADEIIGYDVMLIEDRFPEPNEILFEVEGLGRRAAEQVSALISELTNIECEWISG